MGIKIHKSNPSWIPPQHSEPKKDTIPPAPIPGTESREYKEYYNIGKYSGPSGDTLFDNLQKTFELDPNPYYPPPKRPKFTIGKPGDKYERSADPQSGSRLWRGRIAEQVMNSSQRGDEIAAKETLESQKTNEESLIASKAKNGEENLDPAVINFKEKLKVLAIAKLNENQKQLETLTDQYTGGEQSKELLDRLRESVKTNARLESKQRQLERELILTSPMSPEAAAFGRDQDQKRSEELSEKIELLKTVRKTLLDANPVPGLIEENQVQDSVSDRDLQETLKGKFEGINQSIEDVKKGVISEDIPLEQLDVVINEVKAGIPEQDLPAIEQYLNQRKRIDRIIEIGGLLGTLGLTAMAVIAHIFTGGITTVIFAGLGSALGLGGAIYELERADDLNNVAKVGDAGGNQLMSNPDLAKIDYAIAWANLVLAGIDSGLAVTEGLSLFKGAEEIISEGGAKLIGGLTPNQITKLDALATTVDDVEKRELLASLQQELGEDFDDVYSLFARAVKRNKPPMRSEATSLDGRTIVTNFRDLSGVAQGLVRKLEKNGSVRVDSINPGDLVSIARWFEREIGVLQSPSRKGLRLVVGTETGVLERQLENDEIFVFHTHPVFKSEKGHFNIDISNASKHTEAVIDWGGNITYFNKTGIVNPIDLDGKTVLAAPPEKGKFWDKKSGNIKGYDRIQVTVNEAGEKVIKVIE